METLNVFICDYHFVKKLEKIFPKDLSLFGNPKVKVFQGREWFMSLPGDDELGLEYKGEKFDFIFMTAQNLKKYYHHGYKLDLRTILEKYGKEDTKVIVFKCRVCAECNDFVKDMYGEIVYDYIDRSFEEIIKYFNEYIPIH